MAVPILQGRVTEVAPPLTRPVRLFEVCRSVGDDAEPWLLIGEPFDRPRRSSIRRQRSYVDTGFAVLDPAVLVFPVAPRWRIHLEEGRIEVTVDGSSIVEIDSRVVPEGWIDAVTAEGMAWVVAGGDLTLPGAGPVEVMQSALAVGLVAGGLVLLD